MLKAKSKRWHFKKQIVIEQRQRVQQIQYVHFASFRAAEFNLNIFVDAIFLRMMDIRIFLLIRFDPAHMTEGRTSRSSLIPFINCVHEIWACDLITAMFSLLMLVFNRGKKSKGSNAIKSFLHA